MILLYHKVAPATPTIWWVSADAFDRQMADLQAYTVVPLRDYDPANSKHAVITFDGVYENVHQYALSILKKWGYPFELFLVGSTIGGDNAFDVVEPLTQFANLEQLQQMAAAGGTLQWHTMTHSRLDGLAVADLDRELDVPDGLRQQFGGHHFQWFAYPHGDHNQEVVARVKDRFSGALSCVAGNDTDRYQLNRVIVKEETRLTASSVAVIVANYNYRPYVAEAIESVLAQTMAPDEILVIDDCSTDGSEEVIARYSRQVRFVRNENNLGIIGNFNKAVALTRSSYIAFLGADNRMRSDYVERCKAMLDGAPDAGCVYTDMLIFGSRAQLLADRVAAERIAVSACDNHPIFLWRFPEPTPETVAAMSSKNFIHGSSMYRRSAFDEIGGYRQSETAEDHDFFTRMLDSGWGAVHVPQALIEYRQHSMTQANTVLELQLELDFWKRRAKEMERLVPSKLERGLRRIVGLLLRGKWREAAVNARLASRELRSTFFRLLRKAAGKE